MFIAAATLLMLGSAPLTAQLHYTVPQGQVSCPDEQWVKAAVAGRLGRDPFAADGELTVHARIERLAKSGLKAQLEVTRPNGSIGRRSIESPQGDCLELASALELAITMAIEPRYLTTPAPQEPVEPVVSPQASTPPPAAAGKPLAPPEAVAAPQQPLDVSAGISVLGTAGAVPGFTGGLMLGATVGIGYFSVSLEARVLYPTRLRYGYGNSTVFSALGSLVPCARLGRVSMCGVLNAGVLQISSAGNEVLRSSTPMVQAGARVSAAFFAHQHLALRPWLEGAAVLTRTALTLDGTQLWVTWPLAVSGGLSLEMRFSS